MTFEIAVVFFIILSAIVLFAIEKFPVDLTAIIVMAALLLTGIISPSEGISGFSNTATVTVAAMFVLSAAIFNTGALNFVGRFWGSAFNKNFWLGQFSLMLSVAIISAFINVTAVVALFLPIVMNIAAKQKISPSKLLIPLSFGALFGGVNTLIGTSTNILVSSIAAEHGKAPFHMFEMTPLGIVILLSGIAYMIFFGIRLLPDRISAKADISDRYKLGNYFTEIILQPNAKSVNTILKDSPLVRDFDIDVLEIQRGKDNCFFPEPETELKANDILKVRCNLDQLKNIKKREGIILKSEKKVPGNSLNFDDSHLLEAVITHNSRLRGQTLKSINFRDTYGATVLAIRHRGTLMREKLGNTILLPGDVLLVSVKKDWLSQVKNNPDFVIISEVSEYEFKKRKVFPAMLIIFGVVFTAAIGLAPIVKTAVVGAVLMVLTNCISLEEAYKAINWKVIFLLAGVLTLGMALEKSGGADLIADTMVSTIGKFGAVPLISAFFFLTLVFTNFMSNNATAALLAPIAILTAETLGVNSRPFIMAVTFAASLSFITPVGYQTNTMIYGPGNYKFRDFVKVGTPLDILFWILATILIPIFFPL